MEIPAGGGSTVKPPGKKILGVGDQTRKKTLSIEGYGYFLEPHVISLLRLRSIVQVFSSVVQLNLFLYADHRL